MGARDRGQSLVEFALILPVLLAFILGIMEFGAIIMRYNTIANAAREGARAGIVSGCNEGVVVGRAERLTAGLAVEALRIDPPQVTVHGACQVTVHYTHTLITGSFLQTFGLPGEVLLNATSTMQIE